MFYKTPRLKKQKNPYKLKVYYNHTVKLNFDECEYGEHN